MGGELTTDLDEMIVLDLSFGTKVVVNDGNGKGFKGTVTGYFKGTPHYAIDTFRMRPGHVDHGRKKRAYYLGDWWLETLTEGNWHRLPLLNENIILQKDYVRL